MSKKIIFKNHRDFEYEIEEIIRYGIEIISSKSKKSSIFLVQEKIMIIEGLLLRTCALWERFIETEIIYLVDLDKTKLQKEMDLSQRSSITTKIVKAILFSNTYRDFHDIERSRSFFRSFITDKYNVFVKLKNEQIKTIKMVYKLRNYLAHYSDFSKKKLFEEYVKTYNYKKFLEPGRFLLKNDGLHFENLIHNFSLASVTMKKHIK